MSRSTSSDWECWLDAQREKTKEVYCSEPERITSDYNREIKQIENYSGRGLLELIQNADDAGLEMSAPVDVLVEVTDVGLFVANSGQPFSHEGIKSLMLSDNSPKQFRENCIGYKGLGFRSVLNWGSSVLIQSGEVSVGFSESYAAEFLDKLRRESEDVDDLLNRRYGESEVEYPIATLSAPRLFSSDDINDAQLKSVYKHGKHLQEQGYDTVIGIPLLDSKAKLQVQKEIDSLFEEILLFLRNVGNFRIRSPQRNEHWRIKRSGDAVVIRDENGDPFTWELFEDSGRIPQEHRGPHQTKDKYEIKIAVPSDFSRLKKTSNLFVFFPTKVSFPFPMLAHATFQVNDSRNHLTTTEANQFVAEKLAAKMIEAAESNRSQHHPWEALQTVSPTDPVGTTLEELGSLDGRADTFEELLRAQIATHSLIPVQDGTFATPENSHRLAGDFDSLLEGKQFNDVCLHVENKDVSKQLDALGVEYLEYSTLRARLNEIAEDLSIETRADLIVQLVDNELIGDSLAPDLLIDGDRNLIPANERTFLPPQGESVSLPSWVPRHVLHAELVRALESRWSLSSVRELQEKLNPFSVREYNLRGLVQTVVAAANDQVKGVSEENVELRWRKKMLQALWELYQAGAEGVSLSEVPIIIPTRTGTFARADTLYFTSNYPQGELVERLYEPVDPEGFVIEPNDVELSNDTSGLKDFFCWLGVADEPRMDRRKIVDDDFYEYILDSVNYPAAFGRNRIQRSTPDELRQTRDQMVEVQTVDRLKEVLTKAEPHAIIAWLTSISETLRTWHRDGDTDAKLQIKPTKHRNWKSLRDQTLPSYPRWLLRTVDWLPVENGHGLKRAPRTCSTASIARDISPLIGYPSVLGEIDHPMFEQFNVTPTDIATTLPYIGVANSIDDLSWDAFYQVLLDLPEKDPDGDIARRIYRTLVKNRNGKPPAAHREKFVESGLMFGRNDGITDYYPVTRLRYMNTDSVPTPIADQYPKLDLDTRLGAKKVEQLFGVKSLTNADIELASVNEELHSNSDSFNQTIEKLKPFIYSLCIDADADKNKLRTIRDLKIILCRSVHATAFVGDDKFQIELDTGAYLLDGTTAYVVPEPAAPISLRDQDRLARLVGDVFSDALEIKLGKDILSIATATDQKQRLEVLLGGDSAIERLREATQLLDGQIDARPNFTPRVTDAMEQIGENSLNTDISAGGDPEDENMVNVEQEVDETVSSETRSDNVIKGISADQQEFDVTQSRTVTLRRVSRTSQTSSSVGSGMSSTEPDWESAEEIAYWFEVDAGRYPMLVSEVQGSQSYRCDVLSFNTEDRKQLFTTDPDRELIDRYIEVKSSTSRRGGVELNKYQYEHAITHREQYYLYRVYEPSRKDSTYELAMLRDPLSHDAALSWKVSVNPFRTPETVCYALEIIRDREGEQ